MAVPHYNDRGPATRHQGMPGHMPGQMPYQDRQQRRQPGPYAPEAFAHAPEQFDRQRQYPTRPPHSPRRDQHPSGAYPAQRSMTSSRYPPSAYNQDYNGSMESQPRSPTHSQHPDHSGGAYGSRGEPHSRPLAAKSSLPDLRAQDGIANFSRPRKASLRQPPPEALRNRLANMPHRPVDQPHDLAGHHSPQTPPWQRPNAPHAPYGPPSPSSSMYGPNYPPMQDPRGSRGPRMRSPPGPPPQGQARPSYGFQRVDSSMSAPGETGSSPWLARDEFRSSFRSQMTASTAPGTNATERSSVMTKGSSIPSVYANPEEPSLDDVMDMYEGGFGDENELAEEQGIQEQEPQAIDDRRSSGRHSRPMTATSELTRRHLIPDTVEEDLPEPPRTLGTSALDAEIRQSKLIFASPAFLASLPHLAGDSDKDDDDATWKDDNRTSDRSADSDPSATSEFPAAFSNENGTVVVNGKQDMSPKSFETQPRASVPPKPLGPAQPIARADSEPPGSRDRYGFKKENQNITRREYDAWEKGYSEYLTRRKKKWTAYLKENALITSNPSRFPAANPRTKRFVRKGIPPEWRGAAWFYYAGGPAILAKHSGLYYKLSLMTAKTIDSESIERDLHRTFPDNFQFKPTGGWVSTTSSGRDSGTTTRSNSTQGEVTPNTDEEPPIIGSLRRVLHAFAVYNPQIGYCQSLNFIAGLLLLFVDTEEQCFWLLNLITRIYLPGTHEISLKGSQVDLGVLMTELRDTMPAVWDKVGGDLDVTPVSRPSTGKSLRKSKSRRFRRKDQPELSTERLPPISLCMTSWFMSCYIGTLPIESTLRVWDVFFYEGSQTLFKIALGIFKQGESEIKAVSDPMEMFGVVQALPRKMLDANGLMEACFKKRNGFNHINQEAIDEKRQEKRDQTTQEKNLAFAGKAATTSNLTVTEAFPEVRRKGTLFGRKKRDVSSTRS